jgi:ABC-type antimicrobial peptide transport system permease subunit
VRGGADPRDLTPAVREAVANADPQLPLGDATTLDEAAAAAVKAPRFRTWLLAMFSGLAIALASIGLYGVVAYAVARRRKEFGVRMTLGASRGRIASLVLGDAAWLTGLGLAAGLLAAALTASTVRHLLFDARPHDPAVFALVAFALGTVALVAAAVPAWRATRVDPAVVLQAE